VCVCVCVRARVRVRARVCARVCHSARAPGDRSVPCAFGRQLRRVQLSAQLNVTHTHTRCIARTSVDTGRLPLSPLLAPHALVARLAHTWRGGAAAAAAAAAMPALLLARAKGLQACSSRLIMLVRWRPEGLLRQLRAPQLNDALVDRAGGARQVCARRGESRRECWLLVMWWWWCVCGCTYWRRCDSSSTPER
jgi:hypothetical protein